MGDRDYSLVTFPRNGSVPNRIHDLPFEDNLRLLEEIDADTFAEKARELRDEAATLGLEIERYDCGQNEIIDIAVKAFELSQSLREKWFEADYAAKRRILEIL